MVRLLMIAPKQQLNPLESADPHCAPLTPLECADPELIKLKPFGMNRSKKPGGVGSIRSASASPSSFRPTRAKMETMLTQIAGSDAAATLHPRRKTHGVNVGHVRVGGGAPIVVQYMTNTDTADAAGTAQQCLELTAAGSEIVRVTVNVPEAPAAVPEIKKRLLG